MLRQATANPATPTVPRRPMITRIQRSSFTEARTDWADITTMNVCALLLSKSSLYFSSVIQ